MSGVAKVPVPSDALALAPGPIETWQQAWNVERRRRREPRLPDRASS